MVFSDGGSENEGRLIVTSCRTFHSVSCLVSQGVMSIIFPAPLSQKHLNRHFRRFV